MAGLIFIVLIPATGLCAGPEQAGDVLVHVPLRAFLGDYVKMAAHHSEGKSAAVKVKLPFFEIYDPTGLLIYHEDDWPTNARVLAGLPGTLKGLTTTTACRPAYREMLEIVPEFRAHAQALLSSGRHTVLVVRIEKSRECQREEALADTLSRDSERLQIHVLQIVLQR